MSHIQPTARHTRAIMSAEAAPLKLKMNVYGSKILNIYSLKGYICLRDIHEDELLPESIFRN